MISYKKVSLEDQEWMKGKLKESDFRGSEYCFANQLFWGEASQMKVAEVKGFLCTVYHGREGSLFHDFPTGKGNPYEAIQELWEDDRKQGCATVFRGVLKEQRDWMEQNFPGQVEITCNRDEWDYLYSVEALQTLSGKKYHGKRNHIARFESAGEWSYQELTEENVSDCRQMYREWLDENQERNNSTMEQEQKVIEDSLRHFRELGLEGGVLRQEGRTVAFCIGEPLNSDTYIVHIEKAYAEVQGAYPMINKQFAIHNMNGFRYVNREDDLGLEGLRRAKMSYHPELLLEKYTVLMKNHV